MAQSYAGLHQQDVHECCYNVLEPVEGLRQLEKER